MTSLPVKDRGPGGKRDRGLRQPLTSGKKGIAGSDKSRDDGKPLTRWKIRSRAQGGLKPLEKRGRKVQSPILGTGVILGVKTQKKNKYLLLSYFFHNK